MERGRVVRHLSAGAVILSLALAACGPRGGVASEAPPTQPPPPTPAPAASGDASAAPTEAPQLSGALSIWTYPQGDDEQSVKEYKKRFEAL